MSENQMTPELFRALQTLSLKPGDIWTESELGQQYLDLTRQGYCHYRRLNATLGHFSISSIGRAKLADGQQEAK